MPKPLSHTALARKYRPRRFDDVSTQEHVSETLKRAVAGQRVGHAYLFCGPRGVGKTTLARVLAMALNCQDRSADGEPCGVCDSCERIWAGHTALDVVEIDAASNRGVDDARDLRERAMYAPSGENRYKVYIVDEAHMLTREAWNALLKILEEPPPRVIFVFATTEPQKIQQSASPILSRCQRFDFRRIGVSDIVARLTDVLVKEGADAPEDALRIIARKADGGMRDALSLLDQVMALAGGRVEQETVRRVLGLVEEERYLELLDVLRDGRHGAVFSLVEALLDEGYDLVEFYHGLLDALRTVLRIRLAPDDPSDLRPDLRRAFAERAGSFEAVDLVRMLQIAAELESSGSIRRSANPRVLVEMLLLRLSYLDRTVQVEELIRALGGAPISGGPAGGVDPPGGSSHARSALPESSLPAATAEGALPRVSPSTPPPRAGPEPSAPQGAQSSLTRAWDGWLDSEAQVPAGMSAFLRATGVRLCDDGAVELAPPPGPAVERLARPEVQEQIRTGLEPHLGRRPFLRIVRESDHGSARRRVTEAEVHDDTLQSLFRQEPRLKRAVEELDLELMD